jgi:hypothetical protein
VSNEAKATLVADFLARRKRLEGRLSWKPKKVRGDYTATSHTVIALDGGLESANLHLTAHLTREPKKYGFTLVWKKAMILRLDVEPGSTHFNRSTMTVVSGTHWQVWPDEEADADPRIMDHHLWLGEFCRRANISYKSSQYRAPPFKTYQYELPL